MTIFDPYFAFRFILTLLFFGFILYDVIGLVVWYRTLPRFARRVILLKLLQLRSRPLRLELLGVLVLFAVQAWLMTLLIF